MAIKSAAHFLRLACTGLLVSAGMLNFAGGASAQTLTPPPVASGSIVPLQHPTNWGQIYTIRVAPTGDVVFLDVSLSGLYQMKAGTSTFSVIASGAPLSPSGDFWSEGLAMDATGTLYIGQRYPSGTNQMLRIPYNSKDGTWDPSGSDIFGTNVIVNGGQMDSTELQFIDSAAKDGSGTLIVGSQGGNNIYALPVNADGTTPLDTLGNPKIQVVVADLKDTANRIAVDANGNLYFIEAPSDVGSKRVQGIFFVPASVYKGKDCGYETSPAAAQKGCIIGDGQGAAEASSSMQRLDPASNPEKYDGVTVDATGNLFITDESDSYGGSINGVYMLPNESGNPIGVTAASFNWSNLRFISPVNSNASLAVDPRGFLWIPTNTTGWSPSGENAVAGTDNFVLWAMGSANMGASPVGTVGPTNTVYYSFTSTVTPASIGFVKGDGADFTLVTTDPNPAINANPPAAPCATGKAYAALSSCPVWMALNSTLPGSVSSQLVMLDASSNVIANSTTYIYGVGQGPEVSLLVPAAQTAIATGLNTPQQVATDSLGNSYLADSGQGKVLKFAAGASTATAGTSIGTGLTAPTGVAVDGTGDVYIADSGNVIEIPANLNGTLNTTGQNVLDSGLGTNLKLAVDGYDNVYVADPDNARVLKIANPAVASTGYGIENVGSGFKKPSAIAVDNTGDVFVADGATLSEVMEPFGAQASIINSLFAPVTGLAVDPSGSVDVAQAGGIVRIPLANGAYDANNAAAIAASAITSPNGVALDPTGNLYVSDLSKGTPNLLVLSVNAAVNFGQVGPYVTTDPIDVDVFDIGNLPLTFTGAPTITSTDNSPGEFALTAASNSACDTTGKTSVGAGTDCILDVTLTATDLGARTATMTVPTNALNVSPVSATLIGTGAGNLSYTTTTFTLNPASGVTYPGTTTASVTVVPTAGQTNPPPAGVMPTGTVVLTLTPQAGGQIFTFSGTLVAGATSSTVSIPAINLAGGTYNVKVTYKGNTTFFGSSSPAANGTPVTLTVAQATPTVTLSEPIGISPTNGVYYVALGANTTLQVSVISSSGTPTGTVNFLNGTQVADSTQKNVALNANGQATFNTDNLPAGTYTLPAVSNSTKSDPSFSSVTSNAITFQVVPATALITASPSSLSASAGNPMQTTLTVQRLAGYNPVALQLACVPATLPNYSECTFTVPAIDLYDYSVQTSVLTISTDVPVNVTSARSEPSQIVFAALFGLGSLGLLFRRRDKFRRSALGMACWMVVFAGTLIGFTGCTNSGYTKTPLAPKVTTPSGTYNVSIIGTDATKGGATTTLPFTISVTVK
jgi:hypothetical protein